MSSDPCLGLPVWNNVRDLEKEAPCYDQPQGRREKPTVISYLLVLRSEARCVRSAQVLKQFGSCETPML